MYTLVAASVMTVFALADPPHGVWRILYDIVLPISLVVVSAWQLFKIRRR